MSTMLVIGDNPEDKVKIYSGDVKYERWVKYRYNDRKELHSKAVRFYESLLDSDKMQKILSEQQMKTIKDMYLYLTDMDDDEYYDYLTADCDVDPETLDAYTDENPKSKYQYEKCYDKQIRETGEESEFSTPFTLLDGTKVYSAKKGEIDWNKSHMLNTDLYRAAWEVCVMGREPKNETEETIRLRLGERKSYFAHFKDVDEYIIHNCSFFCYSVIDENGNYYELDAKTDDKEWIANFYDRFVKNLPDDTLVSLYETHKLN